MSMKTLYKASFILCVLVTGAWLMLRLTEGMKKVTNSIVNQIESPRSR